MKEILTKNYNTVSPAWRPYHKSVDENTVKISFLESAKVEIVGETDKEYEVSFVDLDTNRIVYATKIRTGMWTATSIRYFTNWKVEVKLGGEIVKQEIINLKGKMVKVICDTTSMGDLLAYIGAIDAFQKKHECDLYCVVFESTFNKIFKENYPNIKFLNK